MAKETKSALFRRTFCRRVCTEADGRAWCFKRNTQARCLIWIKRFQIMRAAREFVAAEEELKK